MQVPENSPGGTVVGRVRARDSDGDPVTHSLPRRDQRDFSIDQQTGEITVADGAELDHEYFDGVTPEVSLRQMHSDLLEDLHRLEAVEVGFWLEAPRAPVGGGVAVGEFPAAQWPCAWRGLGS